MDETTVYRTWDESLAEMAVDLLRAEGIEARKVADVPRSVYPFTMNGLGEIAIVVPEEDAPEALDILSARFSEDHLSEIDEGEFDGENEERFSRDKYRGGEFGRHDDEE